MERRIWRFLRRYSWFRQLMREPSEGALIHAADVMCVAQNEDGLVCTQWPNHDGWHKCELSTGEMVGTWPPTGAGK